MPAGRLGGRGVATIAALMLAAAFAPAAAQTLWQGGTGGWTDPGNWDSGVPGAGDDATVDNGGTAQIDAPGAEASTLILGDRDSGGLAIGPGGTLTADTLAVGDRLGGDGTLTLQGPGAEAVATQMHLGGRGEGTLRLDGGAALDTGFTVLGSDLGSQGVATVTGPGTLWINTLLFVGLDGTGDLRVEQGGEVHSHAALTIGSGFGTGVATVTGAGSALTVDGVLMVGDTGTGTLIVEDGGLAENFAGSIGGCDCGVGVATVRGAGSRWINTDALYVGDFGSGRLTLATGGQVDVADGLGTLELGFDLHGAGTLNIGEGGAAGVLNVAGVLGGDGTAIVNFNHDEAAYAFANALGTAVVMEGGVAVNHTGTGTTILDGLHSYTGATTVSAGTLRIDGSIDSAVTVGAGGRLGGTGIVFNDVSVAGMLAPGNSIGTLEISGDLGFAAGAVYEVEVDDAGQSDRTEVAGTATLTGATVRVRPATGSYATATEYTILTAIAPIATTFDGAVSDSAFLNPSLRYEPNSVVLRLERNDTLFQSVAAGGNQGGPAAALDSVGAGATGDVATLIDNLTPLSAGAAQQAFAQLSGASLAAPSTVQVQTMTRFGSAVHTASLIQSGGANAPAGDQSFALGGSGDAGLLALSGATAAEMPEIGRALGRSMPALRVAPAADGRAPGLWASGFGFGGRVHGDANGPGYTHRTGGALVGMDWLAGEATLVGVALGYSRSRIDQSDSPDETGVGSAQAGLHTLWHPDGFDRRLAIDGALTVGRSDYRSERHIAFGAIDRTAIAEREGWDAAMRAGASYRIDRGDWQVTPGATLTVARTQQDAYTETGAGAANLSVSESVTVSTRSRLGLEVGRQFEGEDGMRWRPGASIGWRHEFGAAGRGQDVALAGVPDAGFRSTGPSTARDAVEFGVSLAAATAEDLRWGLSYAGSADSGQTSHGLFADIRVTW